MGAREERLCDRCIDFYCHLVQGAPHGPNTDWTSQRRKGAARVPTVPRESLRWVAMALLGKEASTRALGAAPVAEGTCLDPRGRPMVVYGGDEENVPASSSLANPQIA